MIVIVAIILTNVFTAEMMISPKLGESSKITQIRQLLKDNFIDKIDSKKEDAMEDGEIHGMVDALGDPYTVYMNSKEYKSFNTQITGSYAGIGIYVGVKNNQITVAAPIEGSPADKCGILSGDIIQKVNGTSLSGKELDKAVSLMLGKPGTKVLVTFYRAGKGSFDKQITRAKIVIKSVKGKMLKDDIGYIKITMFDEGTASEFNNALTSLNKKGLKGLIIDLRDNGGGLLDQSSDIADLLLGKGIIVYTIDNKGHKDTWKSDAKKFGKPLVLLVNGGTASASEILSGAVRDFKAGTLIGTKTFGKGIVQAPFDLSDGSAVKITIAKYYTPSGECIQKKGITPNIVLDLSSDAKKLLDNGKILKDDQDNQLQKGISVIDSQIK